MSKISEQKALEAYPKAPSPYYEDHILDRNVNCRAGYIKGYDQAMQDFLKKAEGAVSMISRHYVGEDYTFDQIWEQFKNYMQDESN